MFKNLTLAMAILHLGFIEHAVAQSFTKILRTDQARVFTSADHVCTLPGATGGWYASIRGVGEQQVAISKFDAQGNEIWSRLLEGRRDVLRMDASGEILSYKGYESPDYELQLTRGVEQIDGSLVLTGPSFEFGRMLMMKTDKEGSIDWVQEVDGASDFYHPLAWDADTIMVVTTSPAQFEGDIVDTDMLVYQFDQDGSMIGAILLGSDSLDVPYEVTYRYNQLLMVGATGDGGGPDSTRAYMGLIQPSTAPCRSAFEALPVLALSIPLETGVFTFSDIELPETGTYEAVATAMDLTVLTICSDLVSSNTLNDCAIKDQSLISLLSDPNWHSADAVLQVSDVYGRVLSQHNAPDMAWWMQWRTSLPAGIYFYTWQGKSCGQLQLLSGKLMVEGSR